MQLDLFLSEQPDDNTDEQIKHKTCYVCNETKPWVKANFHIANSCKSGKVHLKGICVECDNHHRGTRRTLRRKHFHNKPDKCDCCGRSESESKSGSLHLDHCYKTGKLRGWLCPQCNSGIGKLDDSVEGLKKAIAYLERTE